MNLGGTIRLNKIGVAAICGTIIIFVLYMTPRGNIVDDNVKVNVRQLLLVSIEAAERGGQEVVKVINQANLKEESKGKTKEGVPVPVTNADYKSHCVMYYGISKLFPSIKVISEEKDGERKGECQQVTPLEIELLEKNAITDDLPDLEVDASDLSVWIDPLDATKEYTEQLYNYVTTMVCIAFKGSPIIGIIHKPFGIKPETTWAWSKNGMSPHLKANVNKKHKTSVIISRSHPGSGIEKRVKNAFGTDTEIIQAGGSGYKSLEVAVGNVTAYVHTNDISKWDICAGDAIINALEGRFTALNGEHIDYKASAEHIHKGGVLASMSQTEHNIYIQSLKAGK